MAPVFDIMNKHGLSNKLHHDCLLKETKWHGITTHIEIQASI